MPYTTFSDGSVLTASQVNTNFRDQVIATVTSGTRPSGTEGEMIYETDTDRFYVYSGSGWVEWGGIGAWVSYTPVWTQSATITKTVTYAKWFKIGRTVTVNINLAATSAGTAASAINVTTPFTAATSGLIVGSGIWNDNGTGFYPAIVSLASTTTFQFFDATTAATNILAGAGSASTAAIASGDTLQLCATYEAAS